ncbi:hypothetical protein PN498_07980 [Oscillatoria sp. CS-180]|uniref:hypothetical protein n=1 Tax=Oscillatoria sp. CS-180 TaxID=3021720 RepID=UPI002330B255|nr:hypothetical protein [Oscillatoria sp. CS-180]MDB9525920.1 hypothetical protein [Oscillatoria sp. CS-180]
MTVSDDNRNFQQRVLEQLDTLTQEVQATNGRLDQLEQDLKDEVKRWDNRFFESTRNELSLTRTIIITAGAAVIFAPLIRELAPAIAAFLSNTSAS